MFSWEVKHISAISAFYKVGEKFTEATIGKPYERISMLICLETYPWWFYCVKCYITLCKKVITISEINWSKISVISLPVIYEKLLSFFIWNLSLCTYISTLHSWFIVNIITWSYTCPLKSYHYFYTPNYFLNWKWWAT